MYIPIYMYIIHVWSECWTMWHVAFQDPARPARVGKRCTACTEDRWFCGASSLSFVCHRYMLKYNRTYDTMQVRHKAWHQWPRASASLWGNTRGNGSGPCNTGVPQATCTLWADGPKTPF